MALRNGDARIRAAPQTACSAAKTWYTLLGENCLAAMSAHCYQTHARLRRRRHLERRPHSALALPPGNVSRAAHQMLRAACCRARHRCSASRAGITPRGSAAT